MHAVSNKAAVQVSSTFDHARCPDRLFFEIFSYSVAKELYSNLPLVCARWRAIVLNISNKSRDARYRDPFCFRRVVEDGTEEVFATEVVARPDFGTAKIARIYNDAFLLLDKTVDEQGYRNGFLTLKMSGSAQKTSKDKVGKLFLESFCFFNEGMLCKDRDTTGGLRYFFQTIKGAEGQSVIVPTGPYFIPESHVFALSQTQFGVALKTGMYHLFENFTLKSSHNFTGEKSVADLCMFGNVVAVSTVNPNRTPDRYGLCFYDAETGSLLYQVSRKTQQYICHEGSVLLEVVGRDILCYEMQRKMNGAVWTSTFSDTVASTKPLLMMDTTPSHIAVTLPASNRIAILDRNTGRQKASWIQYHAEQDWVLKPSLVAMKFITDNSLLQVFNDDEELTLEVRDVAGSRLFRKDKAFVEERVVTWGKTKEKTIKHSPYVMDVKVRRNGKQNDVFFVLWWRFEHQNMKIECMANESQGKIVRWSIAPQQNISSIKLEGFKQTKKQKKESHEEC